MTYFLKAGLLLAGAILLQATALGQGITFTQGKWQEILAKAQAENKPIFVDFYAEWCGPCKFMSKNVFTDAEVGDYYNAHFISVKIDAEKEEPELVRTSRIDAYPSLYYFSPDGTVINKNIGALDKTGFIALGKKVLRGRSALNELPALKAKYEADTNDAAAARSYLLALAQTDAGSEASTIAGRYLSGLSDAELQEADNWTIIQKFVNNSDSREFKYVLNHAGVFAEKYGKSLEEFVIKHMDAALTNAVRQKSIEKAKEAKGMYVTLMKATNPQAREAGFYEGIIDMFYQQGIENEAGYISALIRWMEAYNLNERNELMRRSLEIASRSKEATPLAKAREWSAKALQMGEDAVACYVYAFVLEQTGDKAKAKIYAEKALTMKPDEELSAYVQELLERIK